MTELSHRAEIEAGATAGQVGEAITDPGLTQRHDCRDLPPRPVVRGALG